MRAVRAAIVVAGVLGAACSTDRDDTGTPDVTATEASTSAPPSTDAPDEPEEVGDSADAPSPGTTTPATLPPFEPQPTTPVGPGEDLDDVLRDQQTTTTTGPPVTLVDPETGTLPPPPVPTLSPGPLSWVLRTPTAPDDVTVEILIDEGDCDGRLASSDRLTVLTGEGERDVRIDVARLVEQPSDRSPCPTAPFTPWSVPLSAPLGDREIEPSAGPGTTAAPNQLALLTPPGSAPSVQPSSSVDRSDPSFRVAIDCDDRNPGATWDPSTEFDEASMVLAAGADALGLGAAPWHEITIATTTEQAAVQWALVADARPVAVITARTGAVAWAGSGIACDDASSNADATAPTFVADGEPAGSAPLLDPLEILGVDGLPDGIESAGSALRFAGPESRCRAWIALEDALRGAGVVLGPTQTRLDRSALPTDSNASAPVLVARQIQRRISHSDGRTAILRTRADGSIAVAPSFAVEAEPTSRLSPCLLDGADGTVSVVVR